MSRGEYSAVPDPRALPDEEDEGFDLASPRRVSTASSHPSAAAAAAARHRRHLSVPQLNQMVEEEGDDDEDMVIYDGDKHELLSEHEHIEPEPIVSPTLDRSWLARVSLRTVLLSFFSVIVLILLILLFHPSSPYAWRSSSSSSSNWYKGHPELAIGTYDQHGALAANPLPSDAHFNDVPFAQVGDARLAHDKEVPEWAGGDGGAAKHEQKVDGNGLKSNGTHYFERTVLLVSLDGVRTDYLTRGLTPHLLSVSKKGLRAEYLQPAFPTLTFPNHYSLITGLYPSAHGIIANDFWDPALAKEFVYTKPEKSWGAEWWGGEPVWSTAVKNGLKANVLMWPGPPKMADGTKPTRWYAFQNHFHFSRKLAKIASWLDLPLSSRPNLILAYAPEVDQEGHRTGPDSKQLEDELLEMDDFAKGIWEMLEARNLTDVVDVVFVSDHGMTATHNERLVFLDDILGKDGFEGIKTAEGWPSVGLRFQEHINSDLMLSKLREASKESKGGFNVYTQDDMPERWHFTGNERIAPIYVVPHTGWAITNHQEFDVEMQGDFKPAGNHGYDNASPDMHAIFVAHGPFANSLKTSTNPNLIRRADPEGSTITVIPGFENVEVYGLVCELLGIEEGKRARTNGTEGFWARYLA